MQFLYEIINDPAERIFMKKKQTISDKQKKPHLLINKQWINGSKTDSEIYCVNENSF